MPKAARLTDTGSGHDCFPPSPVTSGSPDVIINGQPAAREGDSLAPHGCTCGGGHGVHPRTITAGSSSVLINGKPAARIGDSIDCGGVLSSGSGNVIIGDTPYKSPVHDCALRAAENGDPILMLSPMLTVTPVFAKSCLRGKGCTDAGEQAEPHENFAPMALYRVVPAPQPEPEQHAQAAKKSPQGDTSEPVQRAQSARKPGHTPPQGALPAASPAVISPTEKPWYKKLFSSEPASPESKPESEVPAETPAEASTAALAAGAPLAWLFGNAPAPGSWSLQVAAAVRSAMAVAAEAGTAAAAAGGRILAVGSELAGPASRVLTAGPGAPLAALAVGMFPGKLNDGEQDFIDKMRLQQLAEQQGTAPTRVRFQWEKQADGRLMPVGYHTEMGSGYDQVPVRMMELNTETGYYEFTTPGPRPVTILWTPDNPGIDLPHHTGNENPVSIPETITVLPIPEEGGWTESYPAPEERGFRDYILILPVPDIPPIYIYLSAPPVDPLEVGDCDDLARRSVKDGMDIDHIPSQGALRLYYERRYAGVITDDDIKALLKSAVAIAIPTDIHRDHSETYGGRNKDAKKALDASDIRAAVESNANAMVQAFRERGYSEEQISKAKADLHKQNEAKGLYEPWE